MRHRLARSGPYVELVADAASGGKPILLLPGGGVRDPAYLGDVSRSAEPEVRAALAAPPLDLSDDDAFREQQRLTAPLGYATWDAERVRHSQTGTTDLAALRAFFGAPPPPPLVEAITALAVPVHIIGGSVDVLSGNRPVRALAAMFRRGTVEMLDGSGHYPWVDRPAAFAAAVGRWAGATPAGRRPSP